MRRPRKARAFPQRVVLGAAAGFGATMVLQQVMALTAKAVPNSKPPIKQDPGEFMVAKVEEHVKLPAKLETAAAKSLPSSTVCTNVPNATPAGMLPSKDSRAGPGVKTGSVATGVGNDGSSDRTGRSGSRVATSCSCSRAGTSTSP